MRWIIRLVVAFVGVAVLGVAGLFVLPGDRIARLASEQITKATGRSVSLSGDVRPSFFPRFGVSTGHVEIANADWSDAGPMLVADRLSIGLDLRALVSGQIKIGQVEAIAPRILLEKNASGQGNWEFASAVAANKISATAPAGPTPASAAVKPFSIERAVITQGSLIYIDRKSGIRTEMTDVTADLRVPDFTGPASFDLSARAHGQPFKAKLGVSGFGAFLAGGVSPVALSLTAGGSDIVFDGRAGLSPVAASGAMKAELPDLAAVTRLAGQPAPDLPKGLGQSIGVSGKVTYAADGPLTLRDGIIRLDQNRLMGNADLFLAEVPRLNGQFTAGALDLSGLGDGGTSGAKAASGGAVDRAGSTAAQTAGWSKATIDVSGLSAVNAEISLVADGVDFGSVKLGKTRVLATLDRSRVVFDLREVQAYQGVFSGQFIVNGRGGLSVGGDLKAANVAMNPLLSAFADYDRLRGLANLQVKFLGVGNSMNAIMNSLSGSGAFQIGKGELRGLDLAGMLRNLDASYEGEGAKTVFDRITATFTMDKGVLSNDDLDFAAPVLTASGAGQVGLGDRTLNYRVTPVALVKSDGSARITVPVLITGTWAKPRFKADLKSIADQKLEVERKKIEAQARVKLEQKLQQELGVTVEEGQSVKDAVKQKLEEEAVKGLLNLFGKKN
ncbi:AsmA family protein [Pseudogemmobacter sp. W21_MBD1_M6]|uniref:AsmA family protein n=1 Tax=Pseudogemmobacter sp. W21_MBD1_M6 TaxID=3240271 RepID=UPI003F97167C